MRTLAIFRMRLVSATCIALLLLLCLPVPALAQEAKTPKDRFNQGVALAKDKQYEEAISVWLDVLDELDEEYVPRAHRVLGTAYKKLGKLPQAWHHLTLYLKAGVKKDLKAGAWLEQVERKLAKTHRKVVISCAPEGVLLDLRPAGEGEAPNPKSTIRNPKYPCPLTWWFEPGKRHVQAMKAGYVSKIVEIDVRERGEQGGHTIRLAAVDEAPEGPEKLAGGTTEGSTLTSGPGSIVKPAEPEHSSRALEWSLIGSGAAVAVAGGILHGIAYSRNESIYSDYKYSETPTTAEDDYDAAYEDDVLPKEIAAYVLYGLGGAAVVTGVIVLAVKQGRSDDDGGSSLSVVPIPMRGGSGAMVTFEF